MTPVESSTLPSEYRVNTPTNLGDHKVLGTHVELGLVGSWVLWTKVESNHKSKCRPSNWSSVPQRESRVPRGPVSPKGWAEYQVDWPAGLRKFSNKCTSKANTYQIQNLPSVLQGMALGRQRTKSTSWLTWKNSRNFPSPTDCPSPKGLPGSSERQTRLTGAYSPTYSPYYQSVSWPVS